MYHTLKLVFRQTILCYVRLHDGMSHPSVVCDVVAPCPESWHCCLSNAMHGQNINLPVRVCVCVCVRHTFSQLAYRSDPLTDFTVDSCRKEAVRCFVSVYIASIQNVERSLLILVVSASGIPLRTIKFFSILFSSAIVHAAQTNIRWCVADCAIYTAWSSVTVFVTS